MATIYEVEITSHWIAYHPDDIKKKLEKALYNEGMNEVTIVVKEKIFIKNNTDGKSKRRFDRMVEWFNRHRKA